MEEGRAMGAAGPATPAEAERAMIQRPSIGIRTRVALGFLALFALCVAATAGAWIMLSRLEVRLRFLATADRYTMEIQQARRFEKNYFLYGTNLQDIQEHVANAKDLLASCQQDAEQLVSTRDLKRMQDHLDRYGSLVDRLAALDRGGGAAASAQRGALEAELRAHGSQMVAFALDLSQKERTNVYQTLTLFKRLPFLFLGLLLAVSLLIAGFLARQILAPLGRLMATTQRIASGDFTPLTPARRFRDEFSNLAIALNTMMRELAHRQDVLVQSHKLRAVGTLTAGVAHEMLKEDYATLSDEARLDMVEDLVTQGERAQGIVRRLLDFAREGEITTEKLEVADLLKAAVSLTANQARLAGARITLEVPENLPPVRGDRQALVQVMTNLVLNALDAVGKGGSVRVWAGADNELKFVLLNVSDDGHGIEPHVLPYIFDPFFTTKPRGKGTGLGLSVSRSIARQHGGDIRAESAGGRGSTFTVLLPAVLVPELAEG
jgi:two-component system NtrC family sensor kinase